MTVRRVRVRACLGEKRSPGNRVRWDDKNLRPLNRKTDLTRSPSDTPPAIAVPHLPASGGSNTAGAHGDASVSRRIFFYTVPFVTKIVPFPRVVAIACRKPGKKKTKNKQNAIDDDDDDDGIHVVVET